jgi:hypothetical protein
MPPSLARSRTLVVALALATGSALPVHGQRLDSLPAGSRISVSLSDSLRQFIFAPKRQGVIGSLTRVTPDSLFLTVGPSTPLGFARTDVRGVSVSAGNSRGFSAFQVGAIAALFAFATRNGEIDARKRFAIVGVSAGIGALVGALFPFEAWRGVGR